MNDYEYTVTLKVRVAAFSEDDAREMLNDTFGQGEDCGITIEESEFNGPINNQATV